MIIQNNKFSISDFSCKCGCGKTIVNPRILMFLHILFSKCPDRGIRISSINRCEKHNADVGGVQYSKHIDGCAVDLCWNRKELSLTAFIVDLLSDLNLHFIDYPFGMHVYTNVIFDVFDIVE